MKNLMIIDGNSIINRAYYGVRPLSTKDGTPTNAIYGFLNILFKYIGEYNPNYLCVAFDIPKPTFRHKQYADYKAQRKSMPDDLRVQMPIAKEIISAMNIPIFEKEGFEADDIIGTVGRICTDNDVNCYIVTGDKDDLQLLSKNTKVLLTSTRQGLTETRVFDESELMQDYGVTPTQFIDVKAIMGDTSDNIPGIMGIGEKGALDLITKYKNIEYIYENIESLELKPAMRTKLINGREVAFLSKQLSTIDTNVNIDFEIETCKISEYDNDKLHSLFDRLEFKSFIKKLDLFSAKIPTTSFEAIEMLNVITKKDLIKISEKIKEFKEIQLRILSNASQITAISISFGNFACLIEFNIVEKGLAIEFLKDILADPNIKKTTIDVKNDYFLLNTIGVELVGVEFDATIAAYIIDPSRKNYSIEALAYDFADISFDNQSNAMQQSLFDLDTNAVLEQSCHRTLALQQIKPIMLETIQKNGQLELYNDVELPLANVLAQMQISGVCLDISYLTSYSDNLTQSIENLSKQICELAGEEFNINSPKQLSVILFEKLGLQSSKKTKTGSSTDIEVLEKLKDTHPIIPLLIEYRQFSKLKSTYCDGFVQQLNKETGRIHSIFNQTGTVTGRISSSEPNMQNIPVRTELGRYIRRFFIAPNEDYLLLDADYSQIELRVLADISNDSVMIDAFDNNVDIHSVTASQVFHTPINEVTSAQRRDAKAVNFGIVYGIGEYSLSQDLSISVKQAKHYIESYLEKYSGVRKYMDDIKKFASENGYVTTILNRRRYIPEIKSSNFNTRSFGERIALNTPIQGSAADIIKIAMVKVSQRLKNENLRSRLILQVHDELIIETHKDELNIVQEILKYEMEHAYKLKVPLVVDMNYATNWYDAK